MPLLMVQGEEDSVAPAARNAELLAAALPHALDYRFVADQPGGRCRIAHMDDRLQRADLLRRDSPRA